MTVEKSETCLAGLEWEPGDPEVKAWDHGEEIGCAVATEEEAWSARRCTLHVEGLIASKRLTVAGWAGEKLRECLVRCARRALAGFSPWRGTRFVTYLNACLYREYIERKIWAREQAAEARLAKWAQKGSERCLMILARVWLRGLGSYVKMGHNRLARQVEVRRILTSAVRSGRMGEAGREEMRDFLTYVWLAAATYRRGGKRLILQVDWWIVRWWWKDRIGRRGFTIGGRRRTELDRSAEADDRRASVEAERVVGMEELKEKVRAAMTDPSMPGRVRETITWVVEDLKVQEASKGRIKAWGMLTRIGARHGVTPAAVEQRLGTVRKWLKPRVGGGEGLEG